MKRLFALITFLVLIVVINMLNEIGFFRTVENTTGWEIEEEIGIAGAEDITVSVTDSFSLISATKRNGLPTTEQEFGAIYSMNLKSGKYEIKNLTTTFKKPFAPHGIAMLKTNDGYSVMVVNHTEEGEKIERFKLIGDSLIHEKTFSHPSILSPNDVVILDENRFYFTNDHGYKEGIGKFSEEYLGLSVSNVVYFDGANFTEVADGIAYANGMNCDYERKLLFVASPRKFAVKVYAMQADGSLTFIEDIACGTGVDNIEFSEDGSLYVAGHPDLLHFKAYAKGKLEIAPSEIIKIDYRGTDDYTVESIYTNDGTAMSASTVAAPFGDVIFLGNFMDDKFLILNKTN